MEGGRPVRRSPHPTDHSWDQSRLVPLFRALLNRADTGQATPAAFRRALAALALLYAESARWVEVEAVLERHGALLHCPEPDRLALNPELIRIGRRCAFGGHPLLALPGYRELAKIPSFKRRAAKGSISRWPRPCTN